MTFRGDLTFSKRPPSSCTRSPEHSLTGWVQTTAFSLVLHRTVPCQGPRNDLRPLPRGLTSQSRNWERRPPAGSAGAPGESVHNLLVPVFSLDLHFEPLVFRRFGRRQERRQCSALKIISARRWRGHAGEGPWARVPKFCLSENAYNLGKCRTLARSVP